MKFNIITIFPNIFNSYLNESILKRAQKNKLIDIKIHDLRKFAVDKHRRVDDKPYGGGPGMALKIEPLVKAVSSLKLKVKSSKLKVIIFTPGGKQFNNKTAAQLAKKYNNLILICGRYEGIDARLKFVLKNLKLKTLELSVGPYVLTGGELPAMILIDSVSRQIPGVLGKNESLEEKRGSLGISVYTRPEIFTHKGKKYRVPNVLLSGNHKNIEKWKRKNVKNNF
ncbi:tRNA (guanosine(37)-N1)-methyltransferase TrmD [Candidatus Wolfebacteria bacterium]|nr:tRNA (guanosine(37)-N1)-methyltransferase TrmD [Candidatus Wolfebacteria bacterium]